MSEETREFFDDEESPTQYLKTVQRWGLAKQVPYRSSIIAAFKSLCRSRPSEKEFSEATEGLILFPEMLYHLVIHRWDNDDAG